jgi:hypothetical protein
MPCPFRRAFAWGEGRRAPTSAISASMLKKLPTTRCFGPRCATYEYASPLFPGLGPFATFFNTLYDSRARPGSPEPHSSAPRGCPRDASSGRPGPFQDLTSRASLAQGLEYGFRRFEHPPLRLLAPRLVTPTRVTRTPSVASSWLKRPEKPLCQVHETRTRYEPTRRGRLRETRPRRSHFRETFRQGHLRRSPAKRSTFGEAQGAFRRRAALSGDGDLLGEPNMTHGPRGRLGGCPQVVPSLWRSRRRLFNPRRWNTLRQSVPWQRARTPGLLLRPEG